MKSIFDKVIDRRGSGAIKTDLLKERYGREDLIPLWVADMDFKTPDCVVKALQQRLDHPIYGYVTASEGYWKSIVEWQKKVNKWDISREEITFIPGIVRGIAFVLQCFTNPGDKVIVQPPVYMPFIHLVENNGRELLYNPLRYSAGKYEMDLANLQECAKSGAKVLILSNPHNPGGRVWSKETLASLANICKQNGIIVISDEIHADMPLFGNLHTPFPTASEAAAEISITFAAPSKTFNIAGIVSSYAVVKNAELRNKFFGYLASNELDSPMFFSTIATEAAYREGDPWRKKMLAYVEENVNYVTDYLGVNIPQIKPMRPQASFLIWLNCRMLGLDHDSLIDLFVNKAGLALNDGEAFGPGGEGFMRLNVGCPRAILEKAMSQLKEAVTALYQERNLRQQQQ